FPPPHPLPLVKWLVLAHTGNMMAYPTGSRDGGSALTFLLFLAGVWHFGRLRRWDLLALLLVPFPLTFFAAALHRYPYGGSARVAQYLAPAICFLAGTGAAICLAWAARWLGDERRLAVAACGLLAVVGVAGMARDWNKPYKTEGDAKVRQIVSEITQKAGPDDQIAVLDVTTYICPPFEWYLRRQGGRVEWTVDVDWARLCQHGELWGSSFSRDGSARAAFERRLIRSARPMLLVEHESLDLQLGQGDETLEHCEVFRWQGMYGE